jgi:membrane protein implicated in regulation of membrane protease activity
MVTIGAAVLLALFVVPTPWGIVVVVSALLWEAAEKVFWFYRTKSIPISVGPEAMIGRSVEVVAACSPDGTVRFSSERWNANCRQGADVGETVTIEAIERLTLIVTSTPRNTSTQSAPI